MNRIRVACVGYTGRPSGYWSGLDAQELGAGCLDVKPSTLRRWRRDAPQHARFVVPVDPAVAANGFAGPSAVEALHRSLAAADALEADTLLLHTLADLRPTADRRAAMVDFFAGLSLDGRHVAWRAEGLWESQPDARDSVCAAGGLIPVVDPLALDEDEMVPAGQVIYWRVLGRRGAGQRLTDHDLDTVLELCVARAAGYVVFGAGVMMGDARRLRALLAAEDDP